MKTRYAALAIVSALTLFLGACHHHEPPPMEPPCLPAPPPHMPTASTPDGEYPPGHPRDEAGSDEDNHHQERSCERHDHDHDHDPGHDRH